MKIITILFLLLSNALFAQTMSSNEIDAAIKKINGDTTESLMHKIFKQNGWKQIQGEVGSNGIDGLYVKKNAKGTITDVMFGEAKYNKATLGNSICGKQMSKQCLNSQIDKLIKKYPDVEEYKQIKSHLANGNYRARLFQLKKEGNTLIPEIKAINHTGEIEVQKSKLVGNKNYKLNNMKIDINNPKNRFEKKFVENYKKSQIKGLMRKFNFSKETAQKIVKKNPIFTLNDIEKYKPKKFPRTSTVAKNSRKGFTKVLSSGLKKSESKMALKIGALSAVSAIPIFGVAAQVAADMYMANKLSENSDAIDRLKEETKIMGQNINANRQNIEKLLTDIYGLKGEVASLASQLVEVKDMSDKNAKEIKNLKQGIFITGLKELETYYDSNKTDSGSLESSIGHLKEIINIEKLNNSVHALAINSLNIAFIEKALQRQKENKDIEYLNQDIIENYLILISNGNSVMITNSYNSMQDLFKGDTTNLLKIKKLYFDFLKQKVNISLKKHQFEDALYYAGLAKEYLGKTMLYKDVETERKKNFNEFKDDLLYHSKKILEENQNFLLYKEAIKIAYREDQYNKMLELLSSYPLDDDFRVKAYYLVFKMTDEKKAKKLENLILSNTTYSQELKKYVSSNRQVN